MSGEQNTPLELAQSLLDKNEEWWRNESECRGEARELGMPNDADAPEVSMGDLRKLVKTLQTQSEKTAIPPTSAVPEEASDEMMEHFAGAPMCSLPHSRRATERSAYRAMLSAAPQPTEPAARSTPSATAQRMHWVFDAAEAHRSLLLDYPESISDPSLSRHHLFWMLNEIAKREMSSTKACRWLGWIQAAIRHANLATLEQIKAINKTASDLSSR